LDSLIVLASRVGTGVAKPETSVQAMREGHISRGVQKEPIIANLPGFLERAFDQLLTDTLTASL